MRTCLKCFDCKVMIKLTPVPGDIRVDHKDVRCVHGHWTKNDGTEFRYKNFYRLMARGLNDKLSQGLTCPDFNNGAQWV